MLIVLEINVHMESAYFQLTNIEYLLSAKPWGPSRVPKEEEDTPQTYKSKHSSEDSAMRKNTVGPEGI